jgi:hypothetical protein
MPNHTVEIMSNCMYTLPKLPKSKHGTSIAIIMMIPPIVGMPAFKLFLSYSRSVSVICFFLKYLIR